MGHLHDRYVQDLTIDRKSPTTIRRYVRCMRGLAKHYNTPPDQLDRDAIRLFLHHLVHERQVSSSTQVIYYSAFKFFYCTTLSRPEVIQGIPCPKSKSPLPDVPTPDEVAQILRSMSDFVYRTLFFTAYSAGLRPMEVCHLTVDTIDGKQGLFHLRVTKGGKKRVAPLSQHNYELLRLYWKIERPIQPWLFPARSAHGVWKEGPVNREAASMYFTKHARQLFPAKSFTMHGLRHAFCTHLLEQGVQLRTLQVVLGHQNIETTTRYARVRTDFVRKVPTPTDIHHGLFHDLFLP